MCLMPTIIIIILPCLKRHITESDQKDRLYTWVLNGWILDDVYQNEQASIFLMKEAISTSDATLIQYVYDRVSLKKGSKNWKLSL